MSSLVSRAVSKVCDDHDLIFSDWLVLATLDTFGELRSTDACVHTGMHKTKVSRAVSRLKARNLISARSNPVDSRAAYLQLTRQGQQLYDECASLMLDLAHRIEDAVEPEDREAFERALQRLTDKAKIISSPALWSARAAHSLPQ